MGRTLRAGLVLLLLAGCATGPVVDNPPLANPTVPQGQDFNPMYVGRSGAKAYSDIFEAALVVLNESGFQVLEHNRYDGHIRTKPRVSPGLVQLALPGSNDPYERLLYTFQSYRHHALIKIQPVEGGGFFLHVIVYKELEDLPRPTRATAGGVLYRRENSVDRQFEIVDPTLFESAWIPKGRDAAMEQIILQRLRDRL